MSDWFRVPDSICADPKMRRLPIAQRWIWVVLLSLACNEEAPGIVLDGDYLPSNESIARIAAVDEQFIEPALLAFERYSWIIRGEKLNSSIRIVDWSRYQGYDRLPSHIWERLRTQAFERDHYTCQYCGDTDGPFEADHIVPLARGGSDDLDNLATACRVCNLSKGAKLISEWRPDLALQGVTPRYISPADME